MSVVEYQIKNNGPELCARYNSIELSELLMVSQKTVGEHIKKHWEPFKHHHLRKIWLLGYMYQHPEKTVADLVKEFGLLETYVRAVYKKLNEKNKPGYGGVRAGAHYKNWFKENHPCDIRDNFCHLCALDSRGCKHRSVW